ncbi:DUF6093 family protein [Glycomyces tenuis]|uniref:DUF6093 family protein n=1 Tax=Glycomyces tenuis TaxID=58116 RepID=UPI0003F4BE26|nr:DUF6093 family protein [Glycomyces tenuis]
MPLPNTRVFSPGWDAHHRPVAEGGQTSLGIIRRQDAEGVFDPDTMQTTWPPPTTIYGVDEPAQMRIVRDGVETTRQVGERTVVIRSYIVAIPAGAPEIRINDEVVPSTASDPRLPDKSLWVHDVRYGSQVWERDLVCQNTPPTTR